MSSETKYKHPDLPVNADHWIYANQKNLSAENRDIVKKTFRKSARFYRALLKKLLPRQKSVKILDLPCGEGQMIYALTTMGYQDIAGYDLDENRLATAEKLGLPATKGDVLEVIKEYQDNTIGCIFCMDFLEHLEKREVVSFLRQTYNKIAPGGMLFIRTPCANSLLGNKDIFNDFSHKWAATSGVLKQLLSVMGFCKIDTFGEHPNIKMRFGLLRVILFQFARFAATVFLKFLGQKPPKIWTSSMWAVAYKDNESFD